MADALAQYATDLRYEDLPKDIVRTAKRTILDTLGCAFGGYTAGPSQIAQSSSRATNPYQFDFTNAVH